jgi:hypothetical protein
MILFGALGTLGAAMRRKKGDPDALAFIAAAGLTDATQKAAVDALVVALKEDDLWTKMSAIYPFVGGSAASHAVNLKSPGTYDGAFSGGWTHSANGAQPNGADGKMDTGLDFFTEGIAGDDSHWSVYSRTNNVSWGAAIGSVVGNAEILLSFGGSFYADWPQYSAQNRISTSNPDTRGFYSGGTGPSKIIAFKNGSVFAEKASGPDTPFASGNACFGTGFFGTRWDSQQYAFGSLGLRLTDAEHAALYTAVQTYQTTLGRNA